MGDWREQLGRIADAHLDQAVGLFAPVELHRPVEAGPVIAPCFDIADDVPHGDRRLLVEQVRGNRAEFGHDLDLHDIAQRCRWRRGLGCRFAWLCRSGQGEEKGRQGGKDESALHRAILA